MPSNRFCEPYSQTTKALSVTLVLDKSSLTSSLDCKKWVNSDGNPAYFLHNGDVENYCITIIY